MIPARRRHAGRRRQWPDEGYLRRQQPGGWDQDTETYVEPGNARIWAGVCVVDVSQASEPQTVAEQRVTVVPVTIKVPLDCVDVRPDDEFVVTRTDDPMLRGRVLTVVRAEPGSRAVERVIHAIDNQG